MALGQHKTLKLEIRGRVHGVGFRFSARQKAAQLGITGSAENMPDGSVACIIQGDEVALESFIAWARKGPLFARVFGVQIYEIDTEPFTDFVIA